MKPTRKFEDFTGAAYLSHFHKTSPVSEKHSQHPTAANKWWVSVETDQALGSSWMSNQRLYIQNLESWLPSGKLT